MTNKELQKMKQECLLTLLGLYKKANAGHIGASLSCLDILLFLKFKVMNEEDILVLSKGHAAAALYAVLAKHGDIPSKELESYYQDGTSLAAHPPCNNKIKGIRFGTGSLGHGLPLATGLALSTRYTGRKFRVFCVISDGDCNEGSTWEGALFAAQHKLDNLTVIMDNNGLQGFGRTGEILGLEPLEAKWKSFNFEVQTAADGNSIESLEKALDTLNTKDSEKPKILIAKTIKGNGVSYMEDKMEWHYLPMSDEQYQTALREIKEKNA